jgi:single-stranded DNA-binding protein
VDYQKIIVIGNLTKDAEEKENDSGRKFVILSLASKVRSGETLYFSGFVSGKMADFVKDSRKGQLILIDGQLDASQYKPEGKEAKTDLKIYVDSLRRLSPRETKDDGIVEKAKEIIKEETED